MRNLGGKMNTKTYYEGLNSWSQSVKVVNVPNGDGVVVRKFREHRRSLKTI